LKGILFVQNARLPLLWLFVCRERKRKHLSDNTLESVLEPLDGLLLVDAVRGTNLGLAAAATSDTLTGALPEVVVSNVVDVVESRRW
jgi:hypothetical protein